MAADLKEILNNEWEAVRRGFFYPQLPKPELVDSPIESNIDLVNLKIKVGKQFLSKIEEMGFEAGGILNEVLTHEVTHFMKYPGSVLNVLRLQKIAMDYVDADHASELRRKFVEIQTNTFMVKVKKHPLTIPLQKIFIATNRDDLFLNKLYQELWNEDLGLSLSAEEKELISKVKNLNYLNKSLEKDNFRKFVLALKDFKPEQEDKKAANNQDRGVLKTPAAGLAGLFGQTADKNESEALEDILKGVKAPFFIAAFSENQIREGFKEFAKECSSSEEFEKVANAVLAENISSSAVGKARKKLVDSANFYSSLAKNFSVPVRKKLLENKGGLYPHSHATFCVGDSLSDLDPFSAPGILPGISKRWVRKGCKGFDEFKGIPHNLLIIDNSGSMPNPKKLISIPVLGATVIADAYLDNNSQVAVYSFGGADYILDFSEDRKKVHRVIRKYSNGGTRFVSQKVFSLLENSNHIFDVSVVSDMAIDNFDSFIDSICKFPKSHRIHLIYTKDNAYVSSLKNHFSEKENIVIYPLFSKEHINDLVMGELPNSIH